MKAWNMILDGAASRRDQAQETINKNRECGSFSDANRADAKL